MPVMLDMLENGNLMQIALSDPWTLPELRAVQQRVLAYLDQSTCVVHGLADVSATRTMPPAMIGIPAHDVVIHPRCGYIVAFGASPLVSTLLSALFRWEQFDRFRLFETRPEALDFLHQIIDGQPS